MASSSLHSETQAVRALCERWLTAVKAEDVRSLAELVTDDVVVVHGNGRCIIGREQLCADFKAAFSSFAVEQEITSSEIVFTGEWAVDVSLARSKLIPKGEGEARFFDSRAITIVRRQSDGSWKVARVMGLMDSPSIPA